MEFFCNSLSISTLSVSGHLFLTLSSWKCRDYNCTKCNPPIKSRSYIKFSSKDYSLKMLRCIAWCFLLQKFLFSRPFFKSFFSLSWPWSVMAFIPFSGFYWPSKIRNGKSFQEFLTEWFLITYSMSYKKLGETPTSDVSYFNEIFN